MAFDLLERAVALPAPDTTPRLWLALLWLELGHAERALPLLESARQLDPLVGINSGVLGIAHAIEGRRAEAERLAVEAVALDGLDFWGNLLATDRIHDRDPTGAAELVAAMLSQLEDGFESERRNASALLQRTAGSIGSDGLPSFTGNPVQGARGRGLFDCVIDVRAWRACVRGCADPGEPAMVDPDVGLAARDAVAAGGPALFSADGEARPGGVLG
jgi:hypothetical protein